MQGWQAAVLAEPAHPEGAAAFLLGIDRPNCQRAQATRAQGARSGAARGRRLAEQPQSWQTNASHGKSNFAGFFVFGTAVECCKSWRPLFLAGLKIRPTPQLNRAR